MDVNIVVTYYGYTLGTIIYTSIAVFGLCVHRVYVTMVAVCMGDGV